MANKKIDPSIGAATQFKDGNPGGPGPTPGRGYKQLSLGAFASLISGDEGKITLDAFIAAYRKKVMDAEGWQGQQFAERIFQADIVDQLEEWSTRGEKRDRDFLRYRIHKAASDVQRQILFSRQKYLMLMAGRRGGKSEGIRLWFADKFIESQSSRCLYIGLTINTAMALLWQPMMDTLSELGIKVKSHNRVDGIIVTEGDGVMKFGGNTTKDEREKNRGPYWDRVAIDECQSQKELRYLVEAILSPTLIDHDGQIAFGGTGPRTRGTYWESLYLGAQADGSSLYPSALRLNWNLEQNPFIKDFRTKLESIRKDKNLTETDSLYIREYLGRIAYDDDALVIRLGDKNAFTDAELDAWIKGQPVTDVRFTAGLDFGFEDADALAIIVYSVSKPERWLVYEWKANRIGTAEIAQEVRKGIAYVNTSPLFAQVTNRDLFIYSDTGGNAVTPFDLATQYGLPIQAAYKQEKAMAFELLQDESRRGIFKVRRGGPMWEEALRTIYKRNEQDQLTREIDSDTYHPDAMDAVLYGMRPVWLFAEKIE
jgi:hypothetical protein